MAQISEAILDMLNWLHSGDLTSSHKQTCDPSQTSNQRVCVSGLLGLCHRKSKTSGEDRDREAAGECGQLVISKSLRLIDQ